MFWSTRIIDKTMNEGESTMKTIIILAAALMLGVILLLKIGDVPCSAAQDDNGKTTMINIARNVDHGGLESSESAWGSGGAVSIAWPCPPSRLDGAPALPAPPPPLLQP